MTSINMLGSYSGIDMSTVEQLMEAERLPLVGLANKKTTITERQNAWKDINTRLKALFDKVAVLKNSDVFQSKSATSTNESMVSMSAGSSAPSGRYAIEVQVLATASRTIGSRVDAEDGQAPLGLEGSFQLTNHDGVVGEVDVTAEDSLTSIMEKINESSETTGIRATLIDQRLVLEDENTGIRNISISDVDGKNSVLEDLGLGMDKQEIAGTNALFKINGVAVERTTNSIDDVIQDVTLTLKNTHEPGNVDTITVDVNTAKTEKAVKDFVDQYNSTVSFIEDKMKAGTVGEAASRGILAGDGTLQRLHASLRQMVTGSSSNPLNTTFGDISSLGVSTTDRFGKLTFDAGKLKEAMNTDPKNVMGFFTGTNADGEEAGFAHGLTKYVDSFISVNSGVIPGKTSSLERSLKDLDKQIENFKLRVEKKEQYYIKMFSALDVAMMQAESQMQWLVGQIGAMNAQSTGSGS